MNNSEVFKVIVISALVTVSLRLLPLFVKIPKNPIMNKFFEALPYSVLTLMVFPDIFTSGGTSLYDIVKILIGMVAVTFLSLKKFGLGIIVSVSLVIIFLFDLLKIYL
ncbi:AzlD domain-containing protein [Leptotrichia shahii]|uniref:AzlD domain-containing protein n=1 Tax=Leptotrichia shahii TaxID=157691 RepID=UPI0028D78637|nr:AzlD domain-containing protein [Leptotrichia shahii]